MKPIYIHPKKDVYNFGEADQLMRFCNENKIRLHGHALLWYKALPAWMEQFKGDRGQWEAILKEHITTIVNHCKGTVRSWDVLNEAFNADGSFRNNIWMKNIGESYIEKAFQYAGEADPTALLFYNDFTIEKPGPKLTAVLNHLEKIKSKGIKIHGIGMQMHVTLDYPTIGEINAAAQQIVEKGFLVHYSELDVSLTGDNKFFTSGKKLQALQKERMKAIVEGYMKLTSGNRFGITLWGVSDNDSWQTEDRQRSRPLLYNTRYKIKPAYCGFLEGLKQ